MQACRKCRALAQIISTEKSFCIIFVGNATLLPVFLVTSSFDSSVKALYQKY